MNIDYYAVQNNLVSCKPILHFLFPEQLGFCSEMWHLYLYLQVIYLFSSNSFKIGGIAANCAIIDK
jgi:hypothetical protein